MFHLKMVSQSVCYTTEHFEQNEIRIQTGFITHPLGSVQQWDVTEEHQEFEENMVESIEKNKAQVRLV